MNDQMTPNPPATDKLPRTVGDAVSQMLQLAAYHAGMRDLRWTGKGDQDAKMVVSLAWNYRLARDEVWKALAELMGVPQVRDLYENNEEAKAQIALLILRAKANVDLGSKS